MVCLRGGCWRPQLATVNKQPPRTIRNHTFIETTPYLSGYEVLLYQVLATEVTDRGVRSLPLSRRICGLPASHNSYSAPYIPPVLAPPCFAAKKGCRLPRHLNAER